MNGFHPPRWVPSSANRRYDRAIHELDVEVLRRIRERRASGPTGPDLLSCFVNAVGDNGRVLTDDEMRNELLSMMAAGYQNIGIAIIQTLRQVALAPGVDEALYAEVSRVLDGRPARADDLPRLLYSDQIVKESLRCAPPAGAIMRRVAADDTLRNWRIAANSDVFISAWVMHRDARYYENPLQFQPERWTPEFERGVPPCAYLPFGRGARACIAGAMAMVLIRLMMVTIAQTWRVQPVQAEEAGARPFDRGSEVPLKLSLR
jgi:cytochrome P450